MVSIYGSLYVCVCAGSHCMNKLINTIAESAHFRTGTNKQHGDSYTELADRQKMSVDGVLLFVFVYIGILSQ